MNISDLDSLFKSFDDKISNICGKLALLDIYSTQDRTKCLETSQVLGNIQYMLHSLDKHLLEQEAALETQAKRCDGLFQLVSDQYDYVEKKRPLLKSCNNVTNLKKSTEKTPRPIKSGRFKENNKVESKPLSAKKENVKSKANKPIPKVLAIKSNDSVQVPIQNSPSFVMMDPITQQEFNSISDYMRGRLTLDVLNQSVVAFTATLAEKYKFIKGFNPQNSTEGDYKRHQNYKTQENAETKGVYFCTINDIKELSSMKNDATIRKVLPCLRHCKRIYEIRGNPQKLVRYCLVN